MSRSLIEPFVQLVATSPEIERRPFLRRPRTMAAAWGGMLACKVAAMALFSPSNGAVMFAAVLVAGAAATIIRFGGRREETPGPAVLLASGG